MTDWTPYTARASQWFEGLRNRICAAFETIEREAGSDAAFEYTPWQREAVEGGVTGETGGGTRGLIKGKVFEKAGVNISTVHGALSKDFAASINGGAGYLAMGIQGFHAAYPDADPAAVPSPDALSITT